MAIDLFLCLFLSLSFILDDIVKQSTQSSAIIAIPSSYKTAHRILNSLLGFFNCNGTLFRFLYFSFRLYAAFRAMYKCIDTHSLPKLAQAGITHLQFSLRWILKSSGWLQFQAILPKKSCIQWENHGYPGWCNHNCEDFKFAFAKNENGYTHATFVDSNSTKMRISYKASRKDGYFKNGR